MNLHIRTFASIIAFSLLVGGRMFAQSLVHEPFLYSAEGLLQGQNGGTGFGGPWFESDASGSDFDDLRAGSLQFNFLAASGNSVRSQAPGAFFSTLTRSLAAPLPGNSGTVWVSFLMRKDSEGTSNAAENYFGLVLYPTPENAPALFIGDTGETDFYSLGIAGAAAGQVASTTRSMVSANSTLLVAKITFATGADTIQLFVNPDPSAAAPSTASATKTDLDLPDISVIGVLAGLDATWTVDEIRLGSTFKEVAPIPGRLANISTRMRVETGDNVLIAGFIIQGNQPKKVIIRAVGPSLPAVLPDRLQDPTLQLHGPGGLLAENDNWRTRQEQEIIASTVPPGDDREPAIIATLPANAGYTAIVRGVNGETGVASVELYELQAQPTTSVVNISSRGFVQREGDVMIGGLIIVGDAPRRVIIRGRGPSFQQNGIANVLQNPTLTLFNSSGTAMATNDDWRSDQEQEIIATTVAPSDDRGPAIVAPLLPGNYTAILSGVDGTTGVGSVEVYQLP